MRTDLFCMREKSSVHVSSSFDFFATITHTPATRSFLASALERDRWSASRQGPFTPGKYARWPMYSRLYGHQARYKRSAEENISVPFREWKHSSSCDSNLNRSKNVKVNFTLEQAMKAQRGSKYIALLFL
jgi:hypothetical protein